MRPSGQPGNPPGTATALTSGSSPALNSVNSLGIYENPTTGNLQLYASSSSASYQGVDTVGSNPLPTAGAQTITLLNGTTSTSATGFFFTKLGPSSAAEDTLYVADPSVGIIKYSLVGSTWVDNGVFGSSSDAYRSLTATVSGSTVTLYAIRGATASGGGQLVSLVDSTGYSGSNVNFSPALTVLATAGANQTFRGVALAPTVIPNNAPTISPVGNPAGIPPNSPQQSITLSGISDGDGGTQVVNVTAVSSNPSLIPNPNVTATATATLSGNTVGAINVVNGGAGYTFVPVVTLSGGGGTGATATAVLVGDVIAAINITNAGTGYTAVPAVTIAPPSSTATATATLSGGTVGSIAVTLRRLRLFERPDGHTHRRRRLGRDGDRRVDQRRGHRDQRQRRVGLYLGADGDDRRPRRGRTGSALDQLRQPEPDRHPHLHPGAGPERHRQHHRLRGRQRRHRQRRRGRGLDHVHGDGQPQQRPHDQPDHQPRHAHQ